MVDVRGDVLRPPNYGSVVWGLNEAKDGKDIY